MGNPVKETIGYHRCLLLFFCVFLTFVYPDEVAAEWTTKLDLLEMVWFIFRPILLFYALCWVGLSDFTANLWRLAEFVFKKAPAWNVWPLVLDLAVLGVLWYCYRHNISPPVEEPEEVQEALLSLANSVNLVVT